MGKIEDEVKSFIGKLQQKLWLPSEVDEWLATTSKRLGVRPVFLWIEVRNALNNGLLPERSD